MLRKQECEKENREPKRKSVSRIPVDVEVCSWDGLHSSVQKVLPDSKEYTYVVETFRQLECQKFTGAPEHAFELRVRINIFNADEAKQWLTNMFSHSKCKYRHTRGMHSYLKGKRVVYKAHMYCHHERKSLTPTKEAKPKMSKNKRPLLKSVKQKKTSCLITLKLTVTVPSQKVRLKNLYLIQLQ